MRMCYSNIPEKSEKSTIEENCEYFINGLPYRHILRLKEAINNFIEKEFKSSDIDTLLKRETHDL